MIRVLLADDQQLLLDGLAAILGAEPDLEVVGLAKDGREAVALARELAPDVAVLDIRMPVMDGIAAARELSRQPRPPRVLVLTTFDLDEHVYEAMKAGASGFLLKDLPRGRLANAIRETAAGETPMDPAVTRRLVERFVRRPNPTAPSAPGLDELSDRELDVLRALARGLTNAEIAAELHLGAPTIKTHVAAILRKLDLRDRVQAVILAYESGLVEPGDDPTQAAAEHPRPAR
jgi:DNA-binding NarL/FixJ family response regulator